MASALGDYSSIRANYLIEDLIGDYRPNGVIKSVHVEANISESDPVVETAWLQAIADEHGYPHAIVAYSDLRSSNVGAELDRHCSHRNMRGVRVPDEEELSNTEFRRGVTELAHRHLSLQADAPPQRMDELLSLAREYPEVTFFLGHAGVPEERTDEYFNVWGRALRRIAAAENVAIKISGLGMCDRHWTVDSIRRWVLEAIDVFGVHRCVFGTNWPVDRLYSDLPTLLNAYRMLVSSFTRDEQEALLFRNAERLYSI